MKKPWLVPASLIALSLVPVAAGMVRLNELGSGAEVTPANARFIASPVPVTLHIVSVTLFAILGALQFSPELRRRNLGWHRQSGRIVLPSGVIAALTGLWMSHFYELPSYDGTALYAMRWLVGTAMLASLLLGAKAIVQRDFARHGIWMIRAYALAMGAGTQVLTSAPWILLVGEQDELSRAVMMGAGWAINIVVAEWIIRKKMRSLQNGVPVRDQRRHAGGSRRGHDDEAFAVRRHADAVVVRVDR